MKLADFQDGMTKFVFHRGSDEKLRSMLKNYGVRELEARLAIYQNNTFYSLIEALKDSYPSVLTTVGEDFFSACAQAYLNKCPPSSPAMIDFAPDFPEFLDSFEHSANFPYLADLARVDLLRHQSYHAADESPLPVEFFASIGVENLAMSKIRPVNSARLLSSSFAVFDIWQLAQKTNDVPVNADKPQSILSIRPDAEVHLCLVDKANYTFLDELQNGNTINDALTQAGNESEEFNPSEAISFLIQSGFVAQTLR